MLIQGPEASEAMGRALAPSLEAGDVVALFGDLGAGKTTFSRGIIQGLGFEGDVASPTFPIVQVYEEPDVRLPLWHVDLYRIEHEAELEELALDEALGHAALVIEWPERLGSALWPETLRLHLSIAGEGLRSLTATVPAAWEGRWPPR
ncbi:MAG TPA: tRNA (adenosine(37)-N6)-threonylcarbamoyltransferase complex ATPase subunit type 1 TsaE [Allosphingosinicella sp.]|nr:tRNA (adenosine(37)-N6)-threonylcarbamoyltransferase complex ATPase subunit type 1 TsaE [Allosphingosinicella sp.]